MPRLAEQTPRRRLLADRAAGQVVRVGGLTVIASVLGILVFLVSQAVPLLAPADVQSSASLAWPGPDPGALLSDEHHTHVAGLAQDGVIRIVAGDGREVAQARLIEPDDPTRIAAVRAVPAADLLAAGTVDGRILLQPVHWRVRYEGSARRIDPELGERLAIAVAPGQPAEDFAIAYAEDGITAAVGVPGGVALLRVRIERNTFSGEVAREEQRFELAAPGPVRQLLLDGRQRRLFGVSGERTLLWWDLDDEAAPPVRARAAQPVTALALLKGDQALVSGHTDGSLGIWFPLRRGVAGADLVRVRGFDARGGAVQGLVPSQRDRSFLAIRAGGPLGLYYSTSQRVLWEGEAGLPDVTSAQLSRRGDAALLAGAGRVLRLEINNPHPEVSLATLFSPVWYEAHPEPAHVWQSSGGTDEFESKLGLVPLLVGTLKATFYSMLLAVPLGILGAMYTSQFLSPALRLVVKPAVELMASLPSVVLGFLAGLWLAPRLEQAFPSLLLMLVVLPAVALASGALWNALPRRWSGRLPDGSEIGLHAAAMLVGLFACVAASGPVEALLFAGDFTVWLAATTGLGYDQRNAVVVGIAMGFAVIPIVFSISEDAFSSVPRNLAAASLALGATAWQTVSRVVLPAASPGLFAAVMIGLGRAIGETMIVLMATGNTPILDWDPFSGFRTLSANIAVEIPEAPQGGTLYRMLFVAALLLFALTFIINTGSELVRQRLRMRFGRF